MTRLLTIIVVSFLFVFSYGQDTDQKTFSLEKVITYCTNDTQTAFSTAKFYYDSCHKKIRMDIISRNKFGNQSYFYKYDAQGNLKSKECYEYSDSTVYEYNYDSSNRLVSLEDYYIRYGKKILNDKTEYKYDTITTKEKKIIKKCIGDQILLFDNSGRLVEKRSKRDSSYYIKYQYNNSLLISESHFREKNRLLKRNLYYYDNDYNMIKRYTEMYGRRRGDKGKNIKMGNYQQEEYKYKNGRIIEKRTIDQGFDPCFSACCGNFIVKYEYIEQ